LKAFHQFHPVRVCKVLIIFNLGDCSELGVEAKKTGGIRVKFDPFDVFFASRVTNNAFSKSRIGFFL
jgi:hypothetical protein